MPVRAAPHTHRARSPPPRPRNVTFAYMQVHAHSRTSSARIRYLARPSAGKAIRSGSANERASDGYACSTLSSRPFLSLSRPAQASDFLAEFDFTIPPTPFLANARALIENVNCGEEEQKSVTTYVGCVVSLWRYSDENDEYVCSRALSPNEAGRPCM